MILKIIRWLLRQKNYCNMCMSRGVHIGFKCEHGHITCAECSSVGVKTCQHHFCTDTKKYFEPNPYDLSIVEELREQNRRLRRAIEREPPQPIVIQPYVRDQPVIPTWQPAPVPQWEPEPVYEPRLTTGGANTVDYIWAGTSSANAGD